MNKITVIHPTKQPRRPHFIKEWAEFRGFESQASLAKALDTDKSQVSRWYKGATPNVESQAKLSELFFCDPESLFRHPDDDWISNFFEGRKKEEIEKMKKMLEIAFPKNGTDD